jgi:ubiquinone biosynthesis protein
VVLKNNLILPIFNLFRLILLFIALLASYPFFRKKSVYLFLKFAGPSFIKLGQALATRPDLVGDHLAKILSALQDQLPPFSPNQVKKILVKEFPKGLSAIFSEFNFDAVASASIAQVHKAKLADKGEIVAVKILRPNIRKIVARDIATLALIIKIVGLFSKSFAKALSDINFLLKETSKSELDLLKEVESAARLKENLKNLQGF